VEAALKRFPWWSVAGISIGLLGNILIVALWTWAVFSTPPHTHARYLIEAGLAFLLVLAALILALPLGIIGVIRPGKRALASIIIFLSLTPFPLSFCVLHVLASWRHITLAP
jgi:hypothetical protein